MPDKVVVCVAGGGNGAHVCAALGKTQPNVEIRVLSLFADEAERWSKTMETSDLHVTGSVGGKPIDIKAKPDLITNNPEKAIRGAHLVLFVVPAFAHAQYFEEMRPHLQPGTVIAAIPGGAGWEFQARSVLGEAGKTCTLLNYITLPWNCRIQEYGKTVYVMSIKDVLHGGMKKGSVEPIVPAVETVQKVLGEKPKLLTESHLLAATLVYTNAVIHPTIMYGAWNNWDGKPVIESPLFYQGLSPETAHLLSEVSDEVVNVGKEVQKLRPDINMACLRPMKQILLDFYSDQISNKTDLYHCLATNKGFEGLRHPMVGEPGNLMPNFNFRYLTEDIPFGLCVIKGVAQIVGAKTPLMDKIIEFGQAHLKKEFLVNGTLSGKDVNITRAPQRYNFNGLDDIL